MRGLPVARKNKSLTIKFRSNRENKLFIMICERYMPNLDYTISATVNDYTIEMRGEKEQVQQAYDDLRKLAIEVSRLYSPDETGNRLVGNYVLSKMVKGALSKEFLAKGLRQKGYDATVEEKELVTNAPLNTVVETNNQLFLMMQGRGISMNKDVRKFVTLVLLDFPVSESQIIDFGLEHKFIGEDGRNRRYILLKPIDELLEYTRQNFSPTEIDLDEPEFTDLFFEGGTITFEDK